ncbi:hypothetical protein SAMN06265349_101126 [Flavobacterium resistens]|uniref:Uncharacterized protein n=1 Tax=Flavobacterium resistens TaxID=443612 RepID=A0A521AHA7_9FLAO|nr:hypothetical protein [Flavobacterium resistens]SMO34204.1 hypothetical protein SAMN06265349_101126 [Flavobacterium resistens]
MGHIFTHILQRFFFGIGGLIRWCFFQLLNASIEEKYPKDLDYYMDLKNQVLDKNGFTTANKNFFVSIFIFVSFILLIKKIEG